MSDEIVRQAVVRAVQRAYEDWAAEHPSLAAVIDRITLTQRAAESLRDTQEYRDAVAAYHQAASETDFLHRLTELAGPILASILGG